MSLAFLNVPAHGHVNPTLPLVSELVSRGRPVVYYNTAAMADKIESTGAEFVPYPPFDYDAEHVDPNAARLAATLLQAAEKLLPWLLADLKQREVTAIIYDAITIWGWYAARVGRYPAINSTATMVLDQGVLQEVGTAADIIPMLIKALPQLWRLRRTGARLQEQYQVPRPALSNLFVSRADLNLVFTSRAFQPQADRFRSDYRFVGPSIPDKHPETDFPLERLAGRPVIYVSLGTLFNDRIDFFRSCLAAFDGDMYWLVMAVGNKIDLSLLEPLPRNAFVRRHVPQFSVLQRTDLFVTHGGANSINEGLYCGVPLLVYPQMVEQGFGARRVAALGAGRIMGDGDLRPDRLRALVEAMLADRRYHEQARQLGDSFREAGGFRRAADAVEAFIDERADHGGRANNG